ncbi:anthranilate synthase component II [Microbacterium sp. JB110]|uniref:anthranilate synthase component II n=1 Tax=Microbacterium sp. JB110 TaxID=2024477 RepID=UPI001BB0A882|nr:aminodeoxychorismate/anthranilate synthase component II [Microbacterium sp. JB110]
MTRSPEPPRVLLVDHYDSYTGNIAQILWVLTGTEPRLVQSDLVDAAEIAAATHIVLGPGPGSPHRAADVGHTLDVLDAARVPVFGVCFGFQAMTVALGGRVEKAPRPAHGLVEAVTHDGSAMFAGVPETFDAVRYHSLVVAEPAPLRITARSRDGLPMAGETEDRRWTGVQFHPESIGTRHGARMIETFLDERTPDA